LPWQSFFEFGSDLSRSFGKLIVKVTLKDHGSYGAQACLNAIEVGALDREHSLFQLERLAPVFDWKKVGSRLIHPDPGASGLPTLDPLAYITNLLINPANQFLATLHVSRCLVGAGGGCEFEFHCGISF
jgi:hypothetical protein